MGTIELSERELKVLEAIIDNMQEVKLGKTVYRIRDIFVVLYNHFKKINLSINRQAIYYSVEKLEEVGLLKKVAKTHSSDSENEKVVYELQLERFDQTRIIQIKNRYGKRKKIRKTETLPRLRIKPSWFTIEPYEPPDPPMSELEIKIKQRRDEIRNEIASLEKLLEQKRGELEEADNAITHAKEASKFLEKKADISGTSQEKLKVQSKQKFVSAENTTAKKTLKLLPREKQVLEGVIEYLAETGVNQIKSIKSTLSKHFASKKVKISDATIFHAVKGLEEVGFLKVVDTKKLAVSKQGVFVYEFNKELFENSEIFIQIGLFRKLVSKSVRPKIAR